MKNILPISVFFLLAPGSAMANIGNLYANTGASLVQHDGKQEAGYFYQVGFNQPLSRFLSVDINWHHVETLDNSIADNSDDFSKQYDAYSVGLRVDQPVGWFSVYGKAGGSYIESETTFWNDSTSSKETTTEEDIQPYASAGISFSTPSAQNLTIGAAIHYQWLDNGDYSTSLTAGANLAF